MQIEYPIFVVIEGGDGAGKTTQCNMLADAVERSGVRAIRLREPGTTALGERLRGLLLNRDAAISPMAELMMFAAARAELMAQVVEPMMRTPSPLVVIADRFTDTTMAYQGAGRGLPQDLIRTMMDHIVAPRYRPIIKIILSVSAETALHRIGSEPDAIEAEGHEFHERVRRHFETVEGVHIDGSLDRIAIHERIVRAVQEAHDTLLKQVYLSNRETIKAATAEDVRHFMSQVPCACSRQGEFFLEEARSGFELSFLSCAVCKKGEGIS